MSKLPKLSPEIVMLWYPKVVGVLAMLICDTAGGSNEKPNPLKPVPTIAATVNSGLTTPFDM